jgi:hypothetical protein
MEDQLVIGHGINDGVREVTGDTSMGKHFGQWYWMYDWLGQKCKAWYFGPRLDWMFLEKDEKEQIEKERKKDYETRPRIRKTIRTSSTKPTATSDGSNGGDEQVRNNRKVVST